MCFPQMQAAADKMLVHHSTNPNKSFAVLTLKASQYRISQTRGDGSIVISEEGAVTLPQSLCPRGHLEQYQNVAI